MHTRLSIHFSTAHRGAALVVSMVMLLVITVIGVAVMGGSRLEWLMANNSHLQTDAYRNAEIALATGLASPSINNPPVPFPPLASNISTFPAQLFTDVANWSNGSFSSTTVPTTTGLAAYKVEYLGCSEYINSAPLPPYNLQYVPIASPGNCAISSNITAYTYRVWALGTDGKGAARILQATHTLISNNGAPVPASQPGWVPGASPLPLLDNRVELPQ